MKMYESVIRSSHITLRGIYLGTEFVRENQLRTKQTYSITVEGIEDGDLSGTISVGYFIGGLATLYRNFNLNEGDRIEFTFDGQNIIVKPDPAKRVTETSPVALPAISDRITVATVALDTTVFEQQRLKHIHISPFSPGNLSEWEPRTETDVYLVFGVLSEYTDYRYCCGASTALLEKLGYRSKKSTPDAILIQRATGEYLIAEFKMLASAFTSNHHKDDVDVLVCWDDDVTIRDELPKTVVALKKILEEGIKEGEISL